MSELTKAFDKATGIISDHGNVLAEPLILKHEGGQYVIHQASSLLGIVYSDDVKYYSDQEFQKKFGDQNPRSYEDYIAERDAIPAMRRALMREGLYIYNEAAERGEAPGVVEMSEDASRHDLGKKLTELLKTDVSGDVKDEIRDRFSKSWDLLDRYREMDHRVGEIQRDMQAKGETFSPPSGPTVE